MDEPILLIEDNPGDVFLIREYLNLGGLRFHELLVAKTLAEARDMLVQASPMVVLLDLSLPDSSGMDTYETIARLAPDVPIIILSGLGGQGLAFDMVKHGAQDYLLKGGIDERILEKAISYAVERHRHHMEMKRTAAMYRLLFDNNPTPMWVADAETFRFLRVNEAAIRHYGYTREEFMGMTALDLRPEADHERFLKAHQKTFSDPRTAFGEWRHVHKDGRLIDVVIHADDILIEDRKAKLVVVHDITERKREEQHLRLLGSVIQNTQDAIVITEAEPKDEPGPRILFTNPSFTRQTGYGAEEVKGLTPRILQGPGTDRAELDRIRKALDQWEPVECELVNYTKDGKPFWVSFSIFPVADTTGWFTNWVSVQRDVTEKKRQELELRELNQELDHKVQERTAELSETNAMLRVSNEQITDSIRYAQRIQRAILAQPAEITARFPDSFCMDLPRDIVSGDFHWHHEDGPVKWIAVADCTGHGVPGAMMSIIGNDLLHRAIVEERISDPAAVLTYMNEGLNRIIRYGGGISDIKDGMDIALCAIDTATRTIRFAGAQRPLHMAMPDGSPVHEVPGSKMPLGMVFDETGERRYTCEEIPYESGTRIYLTTDGFYSQFGGDHDKKMLKSRYITMMDRLHGGHPMAEQGKALERFFHEWRGGREQVDDVLVVGVRL